MIRGIRSASWLLTLGLSIGGCAASSDEAIDGDESNITVTGDAPISLANFKRHPKIAEIDKIRDKIESAHFAIERKASCKKSKLTDPTGKIRRVGSDRPGDPPLSFVAYYDDAGALRLLIQG